MLTFAICCCAALAPIAALVKIVMIAESDVPQLEFSDR